MMPKRLVTSWVQKLIHGWLIFCIGGVGSMTYFDGFMPGNAHDQHPYHWTIFEESSHVENPLPPLPETLDRVHLWRVTLLSVYADILSTPQNLALGFSQFFVSGLKD